MYRSAIVDELGYVMFWCDELQGEEQIECILEGHPEWSRKCIEIDQEELMWKNSQSSLKDGKVLTQEKKQ